jgi:hypothetical protein
MNQSQNSALSYGPDGGVSFKPRILGWLHQIKLISVDICPSGIPETIKQHPERVNYPRDFVLKI